ncbi:MAG: acyl-CoA synthetase [Polyangiaceae bacterium UTPRO1]|jgi:long-chain acyl-CoA synthetase|nr:acyl-CoA synthetase [Myxococcales bacterium]OQY66189.1 MAG: acyl-CoA synthetase [Polyangiaceae bacterium UTPRO1]
MSELGFWKLATAHPEHVALVTPDGACVSAGELHARSNQLVHGLRGLGLVQGDVVATLLPNGAPMIELYLAATQSGLYLVPINHHLAGPEIAYILADSGAKAFVADSRFAAIAKAGADEAQLAPSSCFAVGAIPGFRPDAELTAGMPATPPVERTAGQVMNYTSGTTGRPKGVRRALMPFDPDAVGSMFAMLLAMFGIAPRDQGVHLVGSPLYHTAVLVFAGCSLHYGHTLSVMDKWTPEEALTAIARDRVTTTHMVPTQFHRLLALPEDVKARYDVGSLRHVVHAAAPCPVDVKRRMLAWWGPTIYEYYAASEGGGTLVTPQEWLERPGTVGRAWAGSEIRILDDAGAALPPGTPGTVYMKLGVQDFEYHGDKTKTDANRRDGFFTVGDVGYLDDAGYLFLCDRKIDMIISGGANIYPSEIEACLLAHPKVGDAAVFGVPDDDWGESVKAVIEPAPGVEPGSALADEITAFCLERIAKFKVPKSIDFIPELPRDPNGKLYKRKLRDPYWAGRERAI